MSSLGHSFLPSNDTADELADLGVLLLPFAVPSSVSPVTSRTHSSLL